jgi:hypothetical protein
MDLFIGVCTGCSETAAHRSRDKKWQVQSLQVAPLYCLLLHGHAVNTDSLAQP